MASSPLLSAASGSGSGGGAAFFKTTRFKYLTIIIVLIGVVLFSFTYFNGISKYTNIEWRRDSTNNGGLVDGNPERVEKRQYQRSEHDAIIFLWDTPSIDDDWTGILSSRYIENSAVSSKHLKSESRLLQSINGADGGNNDDDDNQDSDDDEFEDETQDICDVSCMFTHSQEDLPRSQYILFDPYYLPRDDWRRMPINLPEKLPYQEFIQLNYHSNSKFPILTDKRYIELMDSYINYTETSNQPISLACPPNVHMKTPETIKLLMEKHESASKRKDIVFVSSNCKSGFAKSRTNYIAAMKKYLPNLESFGNCFKDSKKTDKLGKSINQIIKGNMEIFKHYKLAITFENENTTEFVTEKVYSALFAGSIPVYMGASNIDDWVPTGSIIKASSFGSPHELSEYLITVLNDENTYNQYFQWKSRPLEQKVINKLKSCINGFHTKCKMCKRAVNMMNEKQRQYREQVFGSKNSFYQPYHLQMEGKGDHIKILPSETCGDCFNLRHKYTLMVWIKPNTFGDQRIIDKNTAGKIDGYNFDVQKSSENRGYARLCAGGTCFQSHITFSLDVWTHIAVVYSTNNNNVHENRVIFYINGRADIPQEYFNPTEINSHPVFIGVPASASETDHSSYHGHIDNIAIFNTSLTQDQVKHLMWNKPYGDEENMILYFDFDVNLAQKTTDKKLVQDRSQFNNDGLLIDGLKADKSQRVLSYGKDYSFNKCL